jgi:tetratricopeptide (TPR) repeat protein/outer membrane protein OmpA-like peptidoglycan-associated protein
MYLNRIICFFIALLFPFLGLTQKNVERANELYKKKLYASALPFYEKAYTEKASPNTRSRLANCYKILNKAKKALPLYEMIAKDEKAKAEDLLNYAEVLMMLTEYEKAKIEVGNALKLDGRNERAKLMLTACEEVKNVKPYFNDIYLNPFEFNTEVDENAPFILNNTLYFASDRKSGFNLLKQSSGVKGRDFINLYSVDLLANDSISTPKSYDKFNELNKNTSNVSFLPDGTEAYFCRNSTLASKLGEVYNMQIFKARSIDSTLNWKNTDPISFSTPDVNLMYPSVSQDGKLLFYVSERSSGYGGLDIYMSKRELDESWSAPINLGPKINTAAHEGFPFMARDGKLFFCSKGHPGFGGYDIFYATMDKEGNWSAPINLGSPINSNNDDISFYVDRNEQFGVFSTSRYGNGDDLVFFRIGKPFDKPIADSSIVTKTGTMIPVKENTNSKPEATIPVEKKEVNRVNNFEEFVSRGQTKELLSGEIFTIETFEMDSISKDLSEVQTAILESIISIIKKNKQQKFEIGNTIKMTDTPENAMTLSRKWTKLTKEFLVKKGVDDKRVLFRSYGNTSTDKTIIIDSNKLTVKIK